MIDLNDLSPSEIQDLEQKLKEYKKSEKCLSGYKVTFYVGFNKENHIDSEYGYTDLCDPDSFANFLADEIPDRIVATFTLKQPDFVSYFNVEELTTNQILQIKKQYD